MEGKGESRERRAERDDEAEAKSQSAKGGEDQRGQTQGKMRVELRKSGINIFPELAPLRRGISRCGKKNHIQAEKMASW